MASEDYYKEACKQVKNVDKPKKTKNITPDDFGSTLGRVHVPAQNVTKIQTRKMKGLKESAEEKKVKKAIELKQKQDKANAVRQANIEKVFSDE